jgi:predicted DNA-binding transcriptional regulator AlpA
MQTLLTQRDAATLLALSVRTLERLRVSGFGPRFMKAGKAVRYREADLEAWVAAQSRASTSEPSPSAARAA